MVGGGAAGLSAALVLGRARRRTLVVDAGRQSNLAASGIGGLLGHDRRPPAELYAARREELAATRRWRSATGRSRPRPGATGASSSSWPTALREAARRFCSRPAWSTALPRWRGSPSGSAGRWSTAVLPRMGAARAAARRARPRSDGVRAGPVAALVDRRRDAAERRTAELGEEDAQVAGPSASRSTSGLSPSCMGRTATLTAVAFADGTQRACGGLLVPVTLHQRSDLAAQLGAETAPPGRSWPTP